MKYAIIAAGEGSRLAQEGVDVPKPLVKVQDEHLIDRLIRVFMAHDAEERQQHNRLAEQAQAVAEARRLALYLVLMYRRNEEQKS